MTISIIHPSYGRPELAMQTARKWIDRARHGVEYILCLSQLDAKKDDYDVSCFERVLWCEDANMVKQMNQAAYYSSGDLIIAVSDDFDCPDGWDDLLLKAIDGRQDVLIKVQDGLNNPSVDTSKIIPLPIMDRKYYERFGYIYHPDYNHFFGDEELYRVGKLLNLLIEVPLTFQHVHYLSGKADKDATNIKNNKFHATDKATFVRREAAGFGLKTLSILIPTLLTRSSQVKRLIADLESQIDKLNVSPLVQIIKFTDNKQFPVGYKRNKLVAAAKSDYVCFIDDDDRVSKDYLKLVLAAIQDSPDCCSLNGLINNKKVFKHSITYDGWYETDGVLFRYTNHLNPIKTSIARQIEFPEINRGEDKAYSERLQASGLLQSEAVIDEVLYYYDYVNKK